MSISEGFLDSFLDPIAKVWGSYQPLFPENMRKKDLKKKNKKQVTKKAGSLLSNSR